MASGGAEIKITVSIGVATKDHNTSDIESLL